MRTTSSFILGLIVSVSIAGAVHAAPVASKYINRHDGFLLIWQSIARAASETREKPFTDVPAGEAGSKEITYAKARGLLDSTTDHFNPTEPLTPVDALLMLLRTRSVEALRPDGSHVLSTLPDLKDIGALATHYDLSYHAEGTSMTKEELLTLMRDLDQKLTSEEHEVSLYSEKFHGKGTAFGETFDMNALTAAHRTFPYNTLVRVTNIENSKSVVVRINDRGPFVQGRDMDLSLAAFTTIADRSKGKIQVRFERLGDRTLVGHCSDRQTQRLVRRDVILRQGVPRYLPLGASIVLSAGIDQPFVVRDVVYPDGQSQGLQTWLTKGEIYQFKPSVTGTYTFLVGPKDGPPRPMVTEVVECGQ